MNRNRSFSNTSLWSLMPLLSLLSFSSLSALMPAPQRSPWFSPDYEIQLRADYLFENYRKIASSNSTFHMPASNHFYNFNAGSAYYNYHTHRNWYAEADLVLATNNRQKFGVDSCFLGGRYRLMDDVGLEDPISLVIGGQLTKATKHGLHNPGSFHHGQFEMGAFISAGKEFDCHEFWVWRSWGSLGLGLADVGSPWLVGSLHLERNYRNIHRFTVSLDGLYGMGGDSLHPHKRFKGYGSISHRSLDVGISYGHTFDWEGTLSIAYAYRLYARNFPSNVNLFLLSINYPFSL